jgi:hypothetical protein
MGIQVEFNPDLALRSHSEFEQGRRKSEECIPRELEAGKIYPFLKKGQRNYWLSGQIPLVLTKGDQQLSRPVASVIITEATHFLEGNQPYTKGKYLVKEVFKMDSVVHFDGFTRINE